MSSYKVIAFDCDGVLFDTAESNRTYYNAIREQLGMPAMTEEEFYFAHMHTVNETLAYLFKEPAALQKAEAVKAQLSYAPFVAAMKMEPTLIPLLKKLRPSYKTAVATNRSDSMPTLLREHDISPYFDLIVSANDVLQPKPHPDQLLRLLDYFKVSPHEMLYVGDSKVDEKAAKAAQVPLVAYDNASLSASYHIRSLKEIEGILGI
ncbi:MAG: HAD family hydrolase [Deltaproteobacteria bacterium]|jgi:HAD superfamily hydrolase (TIGR01509 family)|nr:HAD family hydrolase [Deltaproteobacteria bacterium]